MRTSIKAAMTAAAASLALLTPTLAFADTNTPDGDTVAPGRDISYGPGARGCPTRGTAVAGEIRIDWQGGQHFTPGEGLNLSFVTPAGVSVAVPGTPTVPLNWNDSSDFVVVPISTTVSTTSTGGKVSITLVGATSGYNPGGSPNFQVSVDCSDTTAPVISYTLNPASPSTFGWYAGPVAIDWTVTDPESSVTLTGCVDETWSTDTTAAGHDFTCSATSAGGSAVPVTVNVRIDSVPPTATPQVTGTPGANGWYTSDATLHWNVGDVGSGLADATACPDVTINTDQSSTTYSCSVTDLAGNTASGSTTIKRDASAPVVGVALTGTLGLNGWYTSAVGVDWTVTEPTSGPVSLVGCADQSVGDTAGVTLGCQATNDAGLNTIAPDVQLKVDATAPVVSGTPSGVVGSNGWYRGNVTVAWSVTETGSGATACADEHQTIDTTGVTFHCQVSDAAGNLSNDATVTVKRDATNPTLTPSVVGTLGDNGWYVDNVSVGFSYSDATSLIDTAATSGCDPAFIDTDTAGVAFNCVVKDLAGNTSASTFTIKRDASAPVVSHNALVPDGVAGWFVTHPSLDWTVTENVSGPAVLTGCADVASVPDTNETTYSCSAKNQAGLVAGDSVTLKVDTVAPVVSGTPSGTLGDSGWYVGDVTVTWGVVETGSGATACVDDHQTVDTTGVTFHCQVTDGAGNVSNDATVTVKRDATEPLVDFATGPADGSTYLFGDPIPATSCTASDATSGLAAPCTVTPVSTTVGSHLLSAYAKDQAGNDRTVTRTYTVAAWTLTGFYNPVNMDGVVNTVKAGSTVPLKFNVFKGSTELTADIGATFRAQSINCLTLSDNPSDAIEITTTGGTSLRYGSGQWIQNWATPAGGKGNCYRVTMTTADGSSLSANFQLK